MAGTSIRIIDEVSPTIAYALGYLNNPQKALTLVGMYQQRSFMRQFQVEGIPKWEPLAEITERQRRKGKTKAAQARGNKILQDTGYLRRSYSSRTAPQSLWREGRGYLVIGSNVIYARIHQRGGMAGRNRKVRIPARPLIITPEDRHEIGRIVTHWARKGFKR